MPSTNTPRKRPKEVAADVNDGGLQDDFSQLNTGTADKSTPKKPKLNTIKDLKVGEHTRHVFDFSNSET